MGLLDGTAIDCGDIKGAVLVADEQDGRPLFIVEDVSNPKYSDVSRNFKVYEVVTWYNDGRPLDLELYITAMIKWDGCSHYYFGEDEDGRPDGCLHLCGADSVRDHCRAVQDLFDYAASVIPRWNSETAGTDQSAGGGR